MKSSVASDGVKNGSPFFYSHSDFEVMWKMRVIMFPLISRVSRRVRAIGQMNDQFWNDSSRFLLIVTDVPVGFASLLVDHI